MRIYFLIGQSNTGKDTIFSLLLKEIPSLKRYVYNTTRPMRENEIQGETYNFVEDADYKADLKAGKIIEARFYNAAFGRVVYYTPVIEKTNNSYIITGTVDMCKSLIQYYGKDIVVPIFICVEDRERLMRGILREDKNTQNYKEVARRFYNEFNEYTLENINSIENLQRVDNNGTLEDCIAQIKDIITTYSL